MWKRRERFRKWQWYRQTGTEKQLLQETLDGGGLEERRVCSEEKLRFVRLVQEVINIGCILLELFVPLVSKITHPNKNESCKHLNQNKRPWGSTSFFQMLSLWRDIISKYKSLAVPALYNQLYRLNLITSPFANITCSSYLPSLIHHYIQSQIRQYSVSQRLKKYKTLFGYKFIR